MRYIDKMDNNEFLSHVSSIGKKVLLGGVAALALLTVGFGSYYTVDQNEVGAVTRMGALVSSAPVTPGPHLKFPFIDTAHTIRISIDKIPVPGVKIKTKDNQFVEIDFSLTYHTGDPFKVLFKVGQMGATGLHDKLIPYIQSRALDEFGKVSALEIPNTKGAIEGAILKDVQVSALELFGETVDDVQIVGIHYDPSFEANVQEMVKTRNQQISAQNMLAVKETEAQQAAAVAKGQADSAIAIAEGAKQQAIKAAEASAQQVELSAVASAHQVKLASEAQAGQILAVQTAQAEGLRKIGEAEAEVIKVKTAAAGNPQTYAEILRAEASKNWKGDVPKYNFGASNGVTPILPIPQEKE